MKPYPLLGDLREPALRVAMPRVPRLGAPGGTGPVIARCKNREFSFPTAEEFSLRLAHLRERIRTSAGTLYASTRMSNHGRLFFHVPTHEALGRPLRWCMTETARAFHQTCGRRGYCWERCDRSCPVELDRTPVRAGLGTEPTTSSWSRCTASALGTPNQVVSVPRSSRALSVSATVRRRHSAALLAPSEIPRVDARDLPPAGPPGVAWAARRSSRSLFPDGAVGQELAQYSINGWRLTTEDGGEQTPCCATSCPRRALGGTRRAFGGHQEKGSVFRNTQEDVIKGGG